MKKLQEMRDEGRIDGTTLMGAFTGILMSIWALTLWAAESRERQEFRSEMRHHIEVAKACRRRIGASKNRIVTDLGPVRADLKEYKRHAEWVRQNCSSLPNRHQRDVVAWLADQHEYLATLSL